MIILITTSGIGSRLGDLTNYTNKSLINVGDKLSICYIIERFINIDNIKFCITVGYFSSHVKQFVKLAYPNIDVTFVEIENYSGKNSSLLYSLIHCKDVINEPFYFTCCDTLIDDELNMEKFDKNNILYVTNGCDSLKYSTVKVNLNNVINIMNKGEFEFDYIYIGASYIIDYKTFFEEGEKIYKNDKSDKELSDIHIYMNMLNNNIKFNYDVVEKYNDTGSLETYMKTKSYYKSNYEILYKCNESVSFIDNSVIKFNSNTNNINNIVERSKYLKPHIPKIYNYSDNFIKIELINGKPLSEVYEKGMINKLLEWSKNNLWIKIENYDKNKFRNNCINFYKNKTYNRINDCINKKLCIDYKIINNVNTCSIYELFDKIDFNYLVNDVPTKFHGDFILDNILYDNNKKFVLIDWRTDFGGDLYMGDLYYDLAKLRHNIYFNHKNINNNMYNIKNIKENEIILDMKCNYFLIEQLDDYNNFVHKNNYNMKKIKILNGLIWLNMSPLHEYPLSNFLFNLGKYTLFNSL